MRPTEVGVVVVGAEGRDLDLGDVRVVRADRDRPELVLVDGAREQLERAFRRRRRGEVPVLRRPAQEAVAERPADHIGSVATGPERAEQAVDDVRDRAFEVGWGRHVARSGRQFRPRNRYVRHASFRSSTRYGVNSE